MNKWFSLWIIFSCFLEGKQQNDSDTITPSHKHWPCLLPPSAKSAAAVIQSSSPLAQTSKDSLCCPPAPTPLRMVWLKRLRVQPLASRTGRLLLKPVSGCRKGIKGILGRILDEDSHSCAAEIHWILNDTLKLKEESRKAVLLCFFVVCGVRNQVFYFLVFLKTVYPGAFSSCTLADVSTFISGGVVVCVARCINNRIPKLQRLVLKNPHT